MRISIFVIILLLFYTGLQSQPTLTAGNSNPHITLQYTYIATDYMSPPDPTGNYSWDFSSLTASDTFNTRYYGHGSVPGDNIYTSSNISLKLKDSYIFYHTSDQGQTIVGYKDSLDHVYDDQADFLRYPFTYQDSYVDTYSCFYVRSGDTIFRQGIVSVSAKSYGNLKLPYATIGGVLGIKRFETYNDFTNSGNEYHQIESYTWHVPGVALPVLSLRSENFNGKLTENGNYITKESLGVHNRADLPFDIILIDHDGTKIPDIQLVLPYPMTLKIRCINSIGKEMFFQLNKKLPAGQTKVVLNSQNMIPGVYMMIVHLDDYKLVKKFVVTD